MSFRSQAAIDPNSQKGLILLNSITANPLVATGLSLTNAQPLHVAIVDASGTQVVPTSGTGTQDANIKQVNGATVNVGTGAASTGTQRVAVASDSTINAVQSGTWNVTNISGTISLPTGASTLTAQNTGNTSLSSIDTKTPSLGQALAAASVPVVLTSAQLSTLTPLSTVAATQSGTWNIGTLASITNALPAGSNVIGHVITDTGSTTAVTGTVTISGTVTANAGTNLNTSLLALESGGNLATLAGGVTAAVYQHNTKQINGITPLMGNGLTGTGSQRVTIASDNTAFSVNATLSAETTKVIGVTRTADGSGNLLTSTSNALDVNLKGNPLVTAPLVGQSKIAITSTAVQLNGGTSQALTNGIIITAPAGNVAPIAVGGSGVNNTTNGTGNGYLLAAGASVSFAVANTNDIWINGSANDYVSWAGS